MRIIIRNFAENVLMKRRAGTCFHHVYMKYNVDIMHFLVTIVTAKEEIHTYRHLNINHLKSNHYVVQRRIDQSL